MTERNHLTPWQKDKKQMCCTHLIPAGCGRGGGGGGLEMDVADGDEVEEVAWSGWVEDGGQGEGGEANSDSGAKVTSSPSPSASPVTPTSEYKSMLA